MKYINSIRNLGKLHQKELPILTPGMNKSIDKHRYAELDALRGFAALMVVSFHYTMQYCNNNVNLFRYGVTGVDLFFIISGFVIFMSINNVNSGKEFIINRFARLYPVYWVCLTMSFLLTMYEVCIDLHHTVTMDWIIRYLANLTMWQYYFDIPNMEGPYWSLLIELLFYVLIFALYKLNQLKRIEPILFGLVLLQMTLLILERLHPYNAQLKIIIANERFFPLIQFLALFLIGIVFYKIITFKATLFRCLIICICFFEQVVEYDYKLTYARFNTLQWQYAIILGCFILIFILFTRNSLKFIVTRSTRLLGRISYPLYLFHQYVSIYYLIPFFSNRLHLPYAISCICSLVIVITSAGLITVYIDEPIRTKIKKRFLIKEH